jgi:sulfoxide reductase heme-binding subunit YedZ
LATVGLVLTGSVGLGYLMATRSSGLVHNRMLPWILGRSLGIGAYVALSALVALGIWFRHPWRVARRAPSPETLLRAHVTLAACTVALLLGHVISLALDHYSGVGWVGVAVPWHAQYRPTAVALGSLALYGIVLVTVTAALAGSIARRVWLPVHSVSSVVFCLTMAHGVLAGSDSATLWWMYVASGLVVAALLLSRSLARRAALSGAL